MEISYAPKGKICIVCRTSDGYRVENAGGFSGEPDDYFCYCRNCGVTSEYMKKEDRDKIFISAQTLEGKEKSHVCHCHQSGDPFGKKYGCLESCGNRDCAAEKAKKQSKLQEAHTIKTFDELKKKIETELQIIKHIVNVKDFLEALDHANNLGQKFQKKENKKDLIKYLQEVLGITQSINAPQADGSYYIEKNPGYYQNLMNGAYSRYLNACGSISNIINALSHNEEGD
jgi:hypothetical protein